MRKIIILIIFVFSISALPVLANAEVSTCTQILSLEYDEAEDLLTPTGSPANPITYYIYGDAHGMVQIIQAAYARQAIVKLTFWNYLKNGKKVMKHVAIGSADCPQQPGPCGNGIKDLYEECDDGNTNNTDDCLTTCMAAMCGDGAIQAGVEVCDDGNTTNGDGCSGNCKSNESCGNGIVDSSVGEICDDGNVVDGDGCSAMCQIEAPPVCGNGILETGEACDDGNTVGGDGCSAMCQIESVEQVPVCGNGVLDPGEVCDDGNLVDGDGCSAMCQIEGFPVCGNGVVEGNEECEPPGSYINFYTICSSTCKKKFKFLFFSICGDGYLNMAAGEQCDDGNTINGDGCNDQCQKEVKEPKKYYEEQQYQQPPGPAPVQPPQRLKKTPVVR